MICTIFKEEIENCFEKSIDHKSELWYQIQGAQMFGGMITDHPYKKLSWANGSCFESSPSD